MAKERWPETDVLPLSHADQPGNVVSAAIGLVLVYINLQPECEIPSSTRFEQFQKFVKKTELGHCPPQPLPKKQFLHGV